MGHQSQLSSCILCNSAAIFQNACKVSKSPIRGVYSVQVATGNDALEGSQGTQGKAFLDESLHEKVQFFVYSAADRGGDASYTTPTKVPSFTYQHKTEHYLVERGKNTERLVDNSSAGCVLLRASFRDSSARFLELASRCC
ncbi:hypothetical protein PDIDSM_8268 [Penicillium digitatum]|nr:hypothetical protein PDIDSM_8268 [Penicillium digitatum]